ncbi:hypothetical protein SODG_003742 [Sodalis praecaptivus]|uniref:hypothetical protein n=1 Tax=Sodalis praecaptivus TaxID=1239307 RepID=UPI0027EB148B|nr:hypothetical protein [Sodalis praecaptivus]CAJ0995612.1 hypothetical protein NVIRENTERO_01991 [Sodalis praecaptivus]
MSRLAPPRHRLFRRHRRQLLREESVRAETRRENAKANPGDESAKQPPNMMGRQGLVALFGLSQEQQEKLCGEVRERHAR